MKLQLPILVIAALGVVHGDNLASLWKQGAQTVAAPVTEDYMDGEALKASVIQSYGKYLELLDTEMNRQYRMSTIETVINSGTIIVDINSKMQLVFGGVAAPNEFDYDLLALTDIYNEMIELVNYGKEVTGDSAKSTSLQEITPFATITNHDLADYFYHFHDEVLLDNFEKLGNWIVSTVKEGEKTVLAQADEMEKNSRKLYLWPMIEQVRSDTESIEEFNTYLQQYSTANVWKQYTARRDNFMNMEIGF